MGHKPVTKKLDEGFRVRRLRLGELDGKTIASWESLEKRAMESNAYLSPRFVIPAMRYLGDPKEVRETMFLFVERTDGRTADLVGAGVFVRSPGTWRFPLPHLKAYRSPHSYLSGLLVDRDEAEEVIRAFFRYFCSKSSLWHSVEFEHQPSDGPQAELMAAISQEFGVTWQEHAKNYRATLIPADGGEGYVQTHFSSRHLKDLRRMRRRLEERGEVRWKGLFGAEADDRSVERFLDLEHMGWKGEKGTSLRSRPSHDAFFREMADRFREDGRLFFTELSLDGVVIASTSNLISGNVGFAFKISWHPDYAKMAPGLLNEVDFIRNAPTLCGSLSYIDSGAEEGSFIEQLWSGRRPLASGTFGTTPLGRRLLSGVGQLRRVKQWFQSPRV